jgi:hypothetical protein
MARSRWLVAVALAMSLLGSGRNASAEILHGQYTFPGKLQLGIRPLGAEVALVSCSGPGGFGCYSIGTYKFGIDFSGKIWENPKLTLWLGGEFNLGGVANLAQIELGVFAMMTFEKLIPKIPLVPHAMAGLTFPINVLYGFPGGGNFTTGGFGVKIGGGAYYYLIKMLGLGGEMHFAFAGAFGNGGSAWAGFWDFLAGIRLSF